MTPDTGKALLDHITWLRHKDNVDAAYECKSGVDRCGECEEDHDLILAIEAEARREPLALARDALERLVRWAVDLPGQGTPPVTPDGWRNLRSIIERAGQALAALPEQEVEG